MSQPETVDEAAVAAFAARLADFAETLTGGERAALVQLLLNALDPLARLGLRDAGSVLDPREAALLRRLAGDSPPEE